MGKYMVLKPLKCVVTPLAQAEQQLMMLMNHEELSIVNQYFMTTFCTFYLLLKDLYLPKNSAGTMSYFMAITVMLD